MRLKKLSLFILTVGLLFGTNPASAACPSMTLSNVNSYVSLNTNNFVSLDLRVNKGSGTCNSFFVVIDNGGARSYSSRVMQSNFSSIPIQFYKDASRNQILKSEFEASASEVISGTFVGDIATYNTVYYAYIDADANQYIKYGNYSKNFLLKLYEGDFSNKILRDTKLVHFAFTQFKSVDISLVSTGSAFNLTDTSQTLDFGKLSEGISRGFDIVMLYNAGYTISINSANAGRLKHLTAKKYISYVLSLDGVPVGLASVSTLVKSAVGISSPNGTRLPVSVKIGSILGSTPGIYTDTITINVASAE